MKVLTQQRAVTNIPIHRRRLLGGILTPCRTASFALGLLFHPESQYTGLGTRNCTGGFTLAFVESIAALIQIIDLALTAF